MIGRIRFGLGAIATTPDRLMSPDRHAAGLVQLVHPLHPPHPPAPAVMWHLDLAVRRAAGYGTAG